MFICISVLGDIKPEENLTLERDFVTNEIAAKDSEGRIVGFVVNGQPSGCTGKISAMHAIGRRRVVAKAAVVFGDVAVLFSSAIFDEFAFPVKMPQNNSVAQPVRKGFLSPRRAQRI